MKKLLTTLVLALLFGYVHNALALLPGESIVLDPISGDYTFTYWDEQEPASFEKVVLIPTNKIDPVVKSSFKLGANGVIDYRYTIKNGEKSKQPLIVFALDPVSDIISSIPLPKSQSEMAANINRIPELFAASNQAVRVPNSNWDGSADVSLKGAYGLRISWLYNAEVETDGLQKNKSQDGFGLSSRDLPGIVTAQLDGNAPMTGFSGEGPTGEISDRFLELEKQNQYVSRNAAAPTIAVPAPFDAAILLDRIRTHVATWPSKQLLDPALATQLDRYLVSAADAYRRNQLKAGKEHIETLREMLNREHKDLDHDDDENENGKRAEKSDDHRAATQHLLIDRLAARILDFDLKYVLKRTEREDDEHKKR